VSFAQPAALLGLLLVPVIVALYLWRVLHERHVVSSTWLWTEAMAQFSHKPHRRLPLREPLLLLQIMAVLVLTLVVAGPRVAHAAGTHQIVVLDDSVAMAATDVTPSRFDQARQQVETMIRQLGPDDSLSLVVAGPHARLAGEIPGNIDLAAALQHLGPPGGNADIAGASALAQGIAAESGRGAPRVTFLAAPDTPPLQTGSLPVFIDRIGRAPLNDQSIGSLTVRCQSGAKACEAFARVRNYASVARANTLEVSVDGQPLGREALDIPAGGSLDLTFAIPNGSQTVKATLLAKDALASDNTAWAIVPAPVPLQALLVADNPGQLLTALRAIPGLELKLVSTAAFNYEDVGAYDFLVLDNFSPDGFPSIPLIVVNPPPSTVTIPVLGSNVFLPADTVDSSDPLVQGLDLSDLSTVGEKIATPSWAHVAVGGSNGPLLLDGTFGGARMVVLPFDVGHSAFAGNLAFPLLVQQMVNWLMPAPLAEVSAGASVWLPSDVQAVRDPSGAIETGPMIGASQLGVYAVAAGNGGRRPGDPLFAVTTAAPGDTQPVPASTQSWMPAIDLGTVQHGLWPLAIIGALLALSGEWWFYAKQT